MIQDEFVNLNNDKFWGRIEGEFLPNMNQECQDAIHCAIGAGGFFAGGFCRFLNRIQDQNKTDWEESVAKYFRLSKGDVDIFFPSLVARSKFLVNLHEKTLRTELRKFVNIAVNATDFATTFRFSAQKSSKYFFSAPVQFIRCFTGSKRSLVGEFDFYNSMFSADPTEAIAHPLGISCEREKTLKIASTNSSLLPCRILKYAQKNQYERMDAESRQKFIDWALTTYEFVKEHKKQNQHHNFVREFAHRIKTVSVFSEMLTDSDVLALAGIVKNGGSLSLSPDMKYEEFGYNAEQIVLMRDRFTAGRINWTLDIGD